MKDYWLHQSTLGFNKETKMEYSRKTINYGCAYGCAPHLVHLKSIHCQTIAWEIRVRWMTVTNACTDFKSFLRFLSLTHNSIVNSNPKWSEINLCFS